jgi:hypothetical protein
MIVIAMAALAYTWFSGIFASLTSTAGSAVTSTIGAMTTQFRIEAARNVSSGPLWYVNISIRNVGTTNINLNMSIAYLDEINVPVLYQYIPGFPNIILTPGSVSGQIPINTTSVGSPCGKTLMITVATGIFDSRKVNC